MNSRYNNLFCEDDDEKLIKSILARIRHNVQKDGLENAPPLTPENYKLSAYELMDELSMLIEDLYNINLLIKKQDSFFIRFTNGEHFCIEVKKLP